MELALDNSKRKEFLETKALMIEKRPSGKGNQNKLTDWQV